jgi:hypothetical protein
MHVVKELLCLYQKLNKTPNIEQIYSIYGLPNFSSDNVASNGRTISDN